MRKRHWRYTGIPWDFGPWVSKGRTTGKAPGTGRYRAGEGSPVEKTKPQIPPKGTLDEFPEGSNAIIASYRPQVPAFVVFRQMCQ